MPNVQNPSKTLRRLAIPQFGNIKKVRGFFMGLQLVGDKLVSGFSELKYSN